MTERTNRGQEKSHDVIFPDGTRGTMTQTEWRNRDKSAGIQRVDDVDATDGGDVTTPPAEEPETPA